MGNIKNNQVLRIACIGIRSIPPRAGSAGSDTLAVELSTRLVKLGHKVTAYNRIYGKEKIPPNEYLGINLIFLKTIKKAGFDTIIHSAKATFHIIIHNTADVVYISNGGNSIWGLFLRLFGKKVIILQDGIDWLREKWPWYGKMFLYFSAYITSLISNNVVFDNLFAKEIYENKFKKPFNFIPPGIEILNFQEDESILKKLDLIPGEYLLFVGRFIPDKGLHYLIQAFESIKTQKKLVFVGGSPNPSSYENDLRKTKDQRIIMPGFIYGNDVNNLIKNAYLYIQPSDVEGLSPVILTVMAIGTPLLCSDIRENLYVVSNNALTFRKGDVNHLKEMIIFALENPYILRELSINGKEKIQTEYCWETSIKKLLELSI